MYEKKGGKNEKKKNEQISRENDLLVRDVANKFHLRNNSSFNFFFFPFAFMFCAVLLCILFGI